MEMLCGVCFMDNRPVDIAHLSRYTGGDVALNAEVLRLFVGQAKDLVGQLDSVIESGDAKSWKMVTHSLKGAARGIGAFAMADAAAAAEPINPASDAPAATEALKVLKSDSETVRIFIEAYLNR